MVDRARILVVDDNKHKVGRIIALLNEAGALRDQIQIAQTGLDARRLLSEARYELLILDVALPFRAEDPPDRRGGIKLLQEMREHSTLKLPASVVGLTGFEDLHKEFSDEFASSLWTLDLYDQGRTGWADRLKAKASYVLARASQTERPQFATDLCVLTALHSPEFEALRSLDWKWSPPSALDEVNFVYHGSFQAGSQRTVVAASAPRMGMVATTIMAMKMISAYRPKVLAMVGICAGLRGECEIGDVLVADPTWDWQMGKYVDGKFLIAPDQIGIPTAIRERFRQLAQDQRLWLTLHGSYSGEKTPNPPTARIVPVTSGSAVLADADLLEKIRKQNRKLAGLDMELYGLYAAARDCAPPNPIALGIKAVCDHGDNQKNNNYQDYAAFISVKTLEAFCQRFWE